MMLNHVVASSKRSCVRPCSRSLPPCRASASVGVLSEAKDSLRNQIQNQSVELFTAPEDVQMELQGMIEDLERGNPTPAPQNAPDKFAGSWILLYTSRAIPEEQRSELSPARLARVYYNIDVEAKELTKSLEFSKDGHNLPGCMNMTSTFLWETATTLKLTSKDVSITSDGLKEILQGKEDTTVELYGFRGVFHLTFEDDGLLVGRDNESNVYVLEHRTTRVHA